MLHIAPSLVSRASDAWPKVNHRVNQVMKKYSGKMQKISRLVGPSNISFLNSVSQSSQTNLSLSLSSAVGQQHDVLLLPCNFGA